MIDIIEDIFGRYELIEVYNEAGELVKASHDFGYIAAVVIFCLVLYGVIRIVGSVISK